METKIKKPKYFFPKRDKRRIETSLVKCPNCGTMCSSKKCKCGCIVKNYLK